MSDHTPDTGEHDDPAATPSPSADEQAATADEQGATADEQASATAGEAAVSQQAWDDVMQSLDELGKAVGSWARSVRDDPETRRRASQLRDGLEGVGKQIGDAIDDAARSDFGQQVGQAASKTGEVVIDSARRIGDEVAPHVAGAFKAAAAGIRQAAESMERAATRRTESAPGAATTGQPQPAPEAPPLPTEDVEPPAPAPSGSGDAGEGDAERG